MLFSNYLLQVDSCCQPFIFSMCDGHHKSILEELLMNGLKFIRKQCNFSLSGLADYLGVSRQIISMWENGKKEIPYKRKRQLSQFFGIKENFFGEITEEEKQVLLDKAMFTYKKGTENAYRYIPENENERQTVHFIKERQFTIDEELAISAQNNKELIERIRKNMLYPANGSVMDELTASYRTRYVFSDFTDAYEYCFSRNPFEKMPCWQVMALVSEAVREAFTGQKREEKFDGDCRKEKDTEFVEEIRDIIKKKIENELTNIWQVQQGQTNKKVLADIKTSKEEKTFNDKVADAEKQYQEFKKLNIDCKEFGVMI